VGRRGHQPETKVGGGTNRGGGCQKGRRVCRSGRATFQTVYCPDYRELLRKNLEGGTQRGQRKKKRVGWGGKPSKGVVKGCHDLPTRAGIGEKREIGEIAGGTIGGGIND